MWWGALTAPRGHTSPFKPELVSYTERTGNAILTNTDYQQPYHRFLPPVTPLWETISYTENDDTEGKRKLGQPISTFPFRFPLPISVPKAESVGRMPMYQGVELKQLSSFCITSTLLVRMKYMMHGQTVTNKLCNFGNSACK